MLNLPLLFYKFALQSEGHSLTEISAVIVIISLKHAIF